jgi:hypothetical protein
MDALVEWKGTSEAHLTAAFHLAVTLVHEIAHLLFLQSFKNVHDSLGLEPSVDDQPVLELGLAFTAWLFSGWFPEPICRSRTDEKLFERGSCWQKHLTRQARPKWSMRYSLPFEYIQRVMTQSKWDGLKGYFHRRDARLILKASHPFRYGIDARVAYCAKVCLGHSWQWKRAAFNACNYIVEREDDDEEEYDTEENQEGYGNIPPFGFRDENWTTGADDEKIPEGRRAQRSEVEKSPQPSPGRVPQSPRQALVVGYERREITVTYSGIYHAQEHGQDQIEPAEDKFRRLSDGTLRSLCADRQLTTFGEKDELIRRLEQYENDILSVEPRSHGLAGPGGHRKFMVLLRVTTVDRLQRAIFSIFGVPVPFQHLRLGRLDGLTIENKPGSGPSTVLEDFGSSGWDDVFLYSY